MFTINYMYTRCARLRLDSQRLKKFCGEHLYFVDLFHLFGRQFDLRGWAHGNSVLVGTIESRYT